MNFYCPTDLLSPRKMKVLTYCRDVHVLWDEGRTSPPSLSNHPKVGRLVTKNSQKKHSMR